MPFPISGPLERSLFSPAVFELLCFTSSNFRDHVTSTSTYDHSIAHMPFPIGGPLERSHVSVTVSEIFNVKSNAMVDVTLIGPLNKGQGHLFWYDFL